MVSYSYPGLIFLNQGEAGLVKIEVSSSANEDTVPDWMVVGLKLRLNNQLQIDEKNIQPGVEPCIFNIPKVGVFGMHICYDLWFPETSRALAMNGAQVILHPSLTDTCDREEEKIMARATAIQQQCYYIDLNAGGKQGRGLSIVIGPEGEILNESNENEEVILVEIDTDRVDRVRTRGFKGLGQPLKSFRDNPQPFVKQTLDEEYLDKLGVLDVPKKD